MSKDVLEKEYSENVPHSDNSSLSNGEYISSFLVAAGIIVGIVWMVFTFSA